MHSLVLNLIKGSSLIYYLFFCLLTFLEIVMPKHYDVTNIFQQPEIKYSWKDYAACVVLAAAVAVPFIIYIW